MMRARRYFVRGVVQGVGFRYFTQRAARDAGVAGYVRNLADGRVEVVAEGDPGAFERFERSIRSGPPLARVDGVEVETGNPPVGYARFEIRQQQVTGS